jgi:hypothetical protein
MPRCVADESMKGVAYYLLEVLKYFYDTCNKIISENERLAWIDTLSASFGLGEYCVTVVAY